MNGISDPGLSAYADLLLADGFTVWVPKGSPGTFFTYSRLVGDRECFGYVQVELLGHYSHSMPIRPSARDGSSMVVNLPYAALTVNAARHVARPSNTGPWLVGPRENYRDPFWLDRLYEKVEPAANRG